MRVSLSASLVSAALTLTASLFATSSPATAAAPPVDYVALGDSYSSASGVLPIDLTAPQCTRSLRNYPHVIAQTIGADLTDVTCGGATTGDFEKSQFPGTAPQLDAVSADTDLVTMTIGGNDSNVFISAVALCGAAGLSTLGVGSPCQDRYGSRFVDTIRTTTYPALVQALTDVRAKAPHARVAILGYPWAVPATRGCFPQMPLAVGDLPYLRDLEATLNDAVRRAAAVTGATYVDFSTVSEGHDACQDAATRWIEPVIGGSNPVIVHPNAEGERQMALQTMRVLGL